LSHDLDGNLIQDGKPISNCATPDGAWTCAWDGENRLIRVEPVTPVGDVSRKLEFAYDYMGRWAQKKVYSRTAGAWILASDRRFVYDGWNVVMVVDSSGTPQQKYTWGLDLSGLGGLRGESGSAGIHGAGGIGGLLAAVETTAPHAGSYWFFFDGNGNVGQVIRASDQGIAARYEYDPYGTTLVAEGAYAAANPFRFSTKWCHTEPGTGHESYYYGYRYYSPRLGRWLSRDPIGERGGRNLCGLAANDPTNRFDANGRLGAEDIGKGIGIIGRIQQAVDCLGCAEALKEAKKCTGMANAILKACERGCIAMNCATAKEIECLIECTKMHRNLVKFCLRSIAGAIPECAECIMSSGPDPRPPRAQPL